METQAMVEMMVIGKIQGFVTGICPMTRKSKRSRRPLRSSKRIFRNFRVNGVILKINEYFFLFLMISTKDPHFPLKQQYEHLKRKTPI